MEAIAVIAVVVGLTAAVGAALRRNEIRANAPVPEPAARSLEQDEIDAIFANTVLDFDGARAALISARLRQVMLRRVPVKSVRPAPTPRTARVIFADGTVVIARGYRVGDLGMLSVSVLTDSPVVLRSYHQENDFTRLEFVVHDDRRFAAQAVGLDQSD